jgi:hypothetical protein
VDWLGVDACALLIQFASHGLTGDDARLLKGLGALAFECDDLISRPYERTSLSGPMRGLKKALSKRAIDSASPDLLPGYFSALCIVDDCNYAARRRGHPPLSTEIRDQDVDAALARCVERYLIEFPEAHDTKRWRALARRSPKLIPETQPQVRSLADVLREPNVSYS